MMKHIVIVLSFSIIMHVHAMEIQSRTDDEKFCYLAHMPLEVQDLIVSFLNLKDEETEEEFIARISCSARPGIEYNKFVFPENTISRLICTFFPNYIEARHAFCPDRTYLAILKLNPNGYLPSLTIINLKKNQRILIDQPIGHGYCKAIALSRQANMIAIFGRPLCKDRDSSCYVTIQNIVTQKKHIIEQSNDIMHSIDVFEFNKQGTHVIIQGSRWDKLLPPSIYSFNTGAKKISTLLEIEDFNQKTPLQQYLIERRVCKSIEASNPPILPFTMPALRSLG